MARLYVEGQRFRALRAGHLDRLSCLPGVASLQVQRGRQEGAGVSHELHISPVAILPQLCEVERDRSTVTIDLHWHFSCRHASVAHQRNRDGRLVSVDALDLPIRLLAVGGLVVTGEALSQRQVRMFTGGVYGGT